MIAVRSAPLVAYSSPCRRRPTTIASADIEVARNADRPSRRAGPLFLEKRESEACHEYIGFHSSRDTFGAVDFCALFLASHKGQFLTEDAVQALRIYSFSVNYIIREFEAGWRGNFGQLLAGGCSAPDLAINSSVRICTPCAPARQQIQIQIIVGKGWVGSSSARHRYETCASCSRSHIRFGQKSSARRNSPKITCTAGKHEIKDISAKENCEKIWAECGLWSWFVCDSGSDTCKIAVCAPLPGGQTTHA